MRSRLLFAPLLLGALVLSLPLAADEAPSPEIPSPETLAEGKSLYRGLCRDCHGSRAQQRALGKSKVLNRLETDEIIAKLRAVQEMANPETPQDAAKTGLSEEDIRALGIYIRTLKRR